MAVAVMGAVATSAGRKKARYVSGLNASCFLFCFLLLIF
jgi:hypothetical protein